MVKNLLITLLYFSVFFLPACRGEQERETGNSVVQPVTVAVARLTEETTYHEALGTVRADTGGTVASQSTGTVAEIRVREGDRVQAGDILVVIDDSRLQDRLRQAAAAEEEAQARADLAAATLRRYQALIDAHGISRQEFDQTEAGYREATAQLRQAEAVARLARSDMEVRAPYGGLVTARLAEAGSLAAPGVPLIALEKTGPLRADISIPEDLGKMVQVGDSLIISVPDATDEPLPGKVLAVTPAADPRSRTITVQVMLPENPALRSGMFARALIPKGVAQKLLVPAGAIVQQGQLTGVYIVDSDNFARFRLIRMGTASGERVEILAGLAENERFVAGPVPGLIDGVRVEAGQ